MVCSVCQEKVGRCANGACDMVLRDRFYCFGGAHFSSRACWKVWFLSGEEEKLTLANKQKPRTVKSIEVIEGTSKHKEKGPIIYALRCANCNVSPEFAGRLLTGGCMERGEWVCSNSCYKTFEDKRVQECRE